MPEACELHARDASAPVDSFDEEILGLPAQRVMTRSPQTVDPEMPLTRVLEELVRTRYKSLPVVQDGHLEGIVSREDVLAALRRAAA